MHALGAPMRRMLARLLLVALAAAEWMLLVPRIQASRTSTHRAVRENRMVATFRPENGVLAALR